MEYAMDMAHTIAANAPISVRLVKQMMQKTYDLDLEAVMQLEVDGMMQCFRSEDIVEGFNAFLEKRLLSIRESNGYNLIFNKTMEENR